MIIYLISNHSQAMSPAACCEMFMHGQMIITPAIINFLFVSAHMTSSSWHPAAGSTTMQPDACCVQSGIHGWGLFARRPIRADTMVIEYRGERVRRTVADARERRYRAAGKDCYLFNVDDEIVVDATQRGTIGRFTVRACSFSLHYLHACACSGIGCCHL